MTLNNHIITEPLYPPTPTDGAVPGDPMLPPRRPAYATADATTLNAADRAALAAVRNLSAEKLEMVVGEMVRRHVAVALSGAADAIEAAVPLTFFGDPRPYLRVEIAAAIVRDAIPPP